MPAPVFAATPVKPVTATKPMPQVQPRTITGNLVKAKIQVIGNGKIKWQGGICAPAPDKWGAECEALIPEGAMIAPEPVPGTNMMLREWGGACPPLNIFGKPDCAVKQTASGVSIVAVFKPIASKLIIHYSDGVQKLSQTTDKNKDWEETCTGTAPNPQTCVQWHQPGANLVLTYKYVKGWQYMQGCDLAERPQDPKTLEIRDICHVTMNGDREIGYNWQTKDSSPPAVPKIKF
jgi:hypothetical protein